MKSEKILTAIPMMQELDENSLDLVLEAIKSCKTVQHLSELSTNTSSSDVLNKLLA